MIEFLVGLVPSGRAGGAVSVVDLRNFGLQRSCRLVTGLFDGFTESLENILQVGVDEGRRRWSRFLCKGLIS